VIHKVKITVTGGSGSGKSTIAAAIARALGDIGAKSVSFKDSNGRYDETYHTLIRALHEERTNKIVQQTIIEVETAQTNRGP